MNFDIIKIEIADAAKPIVLKIIDSKNLYNKMLNPIAPRKTLISAKIVLCFARMVLSKASSVNSLFLCNSLYL